MVDMVPVDSLKDLERRSALKLLIERLLVTAVRLGPTLEMRSGPASAPKCHSPNRYNNNHLIVDNIVHHALLFVLFGNKTVPHTWSTFEAFIETWSVV